MKVLKFGGTSVGTVEGIRNIKTIVEAEPTPVIVVVSALKTVTNNLVKVTQLAVKGDAGYTDLLRDIIDFHSSYIDTIIADSVARTALKQQVGSLLDELSSILRGVYLIKDVTPKTEDAILSYGERCSSLIVQQFIDNATLYDSRQFIFTDSKQDKAVDFAASNTKIQETFAHERAVAIVPGFIASDLHTGDTTTLGRGGSDYTAAIIAAALDADVLEIWTDVDGFMTADPHIIPSAYTIERLTYSEATELCNFGAKVIYPPTIFPVCAKMIPIYVKNTFHPDLKGSIISEATSRVQSAMGNGQWANVDDIGVKGLTSINDTSIVNISGMNMVGVVGINRRFFTILADNGISTFMVAQTSSETGTSLCMTHSDALKAQEVFTREFANEIATGAINPIEVIDDLATIAVVGEQMKDKLGVAGRLYSILGRNGINVKASAQGAKEMNISVVVEKRHLRKALSVIHDSFFLSQHKVVNLFVCGIGTVGGSLLTQLQEQHDSLMDKRRLKLNVVGVANSKRYIINPDGIDINRAEALLEAEGRENTSAQMCRDFIEQNLYNSVFVDCTANTDVAALYQTLLANNISVVAANKIAASAPYPEYAKLKQTALNKGVKFLYETNAGAGLPIIKTISDLCDSGDEILKIEAVLSGTLNFIFNKLSAEIPFSRAVRMAMDAGISEPDPRQDLSGKDVVRKLVILAREAGYAVNLEDVDLQPFMEPRFFEGDADHFLSIMEQLDAPFESRRRSLEAEGKKLRFIARLDNGKATVALSAIDKTHPFYNLEDSNNMVLITTTRYNRYPMIIQGYGAGADVTAAGVFADIIRVANI
ncbi:MAG: bifunctional aspartate kinase/homoserine dehydrogenase I [Bacteroidaceae bacterium]|nr:bifunctional aspartate kinase/homoserine dehydrogenase I [Bacteroidaceae bacterium]